MFDLIIDEQIDPQHCNESCVYNITTYIFNAPLTSNHDDMSTTVVCSTKLYKNSSFKMFDDLVRKGYY